MVIITEENLHILTSLPPPTPAKIAISSTSNLPSPSISTFPPSTLPVTDAHSPPSNPPSSLSPGLVRVSNHLGVLISRSLVDLCQIVSGIFEQLIRLVKTSFISLSLRTAFLALSILTRPYYFYA